MVYIAGSALTAGLLALCFAPFVGFNLMYRYGASYDVVYAAVSIVTTRP